ncbi:S1 family peptidase [Nocardia sp. NPDC019395]|uniref:S1 family peptidase n=1 Tax=Nocardia sp. NPDC019395 TaxID=3154686 RepID=UPI0033D0901C
MRKSVARRAAVKAAIISSAVLLTPLFGAVPATAAPAPEQLRAEDLPPELVQALSRDLHMTPAEYLDRSARAQELQGYAAEFRAQRPDVFAGAWMTPEGKPMVAVTSPDAAQAAGADGYQTRLAPVSAAALETSLTQLNQWVAGQPRDISQVINSIAIDFLNSQLVVNVANTPLAHVLNLPTLLANIKVVLAPDGGGPVEHRPMGGDTYISAPGPLDDAELRSVDVCSFGFNSVDSAGNALNISAGHCNPNLDKGDERAGVYGPNVRNIPASPQLGTFVKSELGGAGTLDYSVIQLNERAVSSGMDQPSVRGANGTTLTVTGTADPVVGAPVCKSGQSSTFTCGFVVADRVETQLFTTEGTAKTIRGFASTACTLGGDSGGAIVTGTLALGITSGSNAAEAPDCGEANIALAQYGGTATLGIPIRPILDDINATSGGGLGSGINVRTRPIAG